MAGDLAKMQRELAALILEPGRLTAFRKGRGAYAKRRGLRGEAAKQFASLRPSQVAYYARRRIIDRRGYLAAYLPKTVAALEAVGALAFYFDAEPYAFEDPRAEAARAARWVVAQARRDSSFLAAAKAARQEMR